MIKIFFRLLPLFALIVALLIPNAEAMPEYAENTNQGCKKCHLSEDGGELIETGLIYSASGYVWPPEGGYRAISPLSKSSRAVIGFLHFVSGFMWFGTILYVHLVLRPAYAAKGLPKTEVRIGIVSMIAVGLTGLAMTVSKIRGLDVLTESEWGHILTVKIVLYAVMVISAVFVSLYIGPRIKGRTVSSAVPTGGEFNPASLSASTGKGDGASLIAYNGEVYDVSESPHWKGGLHFRHRVGEDHTETLLRAPHGKEKLELVKKVGVYNPSGLPEKTAVQKIFYFLAYFNLGMVFAVLLVIAWWRWAL